MSYTLDAVGNRTQRVDQAGTHTYAYDDLYRLTSVTYPGPSTTTYAYDAFGNRTSMTKPGSQATTYAYNDGDRITSVTPPSPASSISYTWDDNGNLTNRGSDTFSWDYEDRMTSATVNSVTTTFAYRGDGLRHSKTTGGNTTTFTWDINAGLPVVLDDGNQYLYGAGLEAQKQSGSWYYYLGDGLGSTMAIVNASGTVQNSYTYDVYGEATVTGSLANEFDFAGQQTDASTGLQYLRARYMDPETGTFLSREPLAVSPGWTGNPHGYASGNPATMVDPTGEFSIIPGCFSGNCLCPIGIGVDCDKNDAPPHVDEMCTGWFAYSPPGDCQQQLDEFDKWIDRNAADIAVLIGEYLSPSGYPDGPRKLTGFKVHGARQAMARDHNGRDGIPRLKGKGVKTSAMRDALKNPRRIQRVVDENGVSFRYYGKDAVVVLNPNGEVVTTWALKEGATRWRPR